MEHVNHPAHYNQGKFEVMDVIDDWGLNFALGNVVKYVARAPYKNNALEDLQKAKWYLEQEMNKRMHELETQRKAGSYYYPIEQYDVLSLGQELI